MINSKTKTLLCILMLVCVTGISMGASIYASIEIDKSELFSVQEAEHLKKLVPKETEFLNSVIIARKQGETVRYQLDVWVWVEPQDEKATAATLYKPDGTPIPLKWDASYNEFYFETDDDAGPLVMYYSTDELAVDFPSGQYRLDVEFVSSGIVSWYVTIPDYNTTPFPDFPNASLSTDPSGQLILDWQTVPDVYGYDVWAEKLKGFVDVYGEYYDSLPHPQNRTDSLGIYQSKGDYETGVTAQKNVSYLNGFGVEFNSDVSVFSFKKPPVDIQNIIQKCAAKAGKTDSSDSIKFSGLLDAIEADFALAMDGNVVVTIDSDDIDNGDELIYTFPINGTSFKKGKYSYARTVNESKQAFKFDTKNGKMIFSAKKTDLTGLSSPITLKVQIGNYSAEMQINEDIVNGLKKPIPIQFMMGVKDTLRVDKAKVKKGKKFVTDSISVKGTFTIADTYDWNAPVIITVGTDTFTVPGGMFVSKGAAVSCKKAPANEGGIVSAKFDSAKCTFTISIKYASLSDTGDVDFSIDLFDNYLLAPDQIPVPPDRDDIPPPRPYTFWELTQYDQSAVHWDFDAKFKSYRYPVSKWTDPGGYVVHERDDADYDVAGASWYYTSPGDGAHLTRFTLWEELDYGSGTYDIDFYDFDIRCWPESLNLGQSQGGTATFQGHIDYGVKVDFEGTITYSMTLARKTTNVTYKGQKYSAIVFTEVLHFMVDFSDFSNDTGTFDVKLKTKHYAVPGLGTIKFERSATVKSKGIPVYGTFTMPSGKETAVLVDTNLD